MNDAPNPRRRFRPALVLLLVVLLAAEGLLWMADSFRWFPKGYALLTAIAAVGALFVLMLGWFLLALVLKRRLQFRPLSLLVLLIALALPAVWLAVSWQEARRQQQAVDMITGAGGTVVYDSPKPAATAWLSKVPGGDAFVDVAVVRVPGTSAFGDAQLETVGRLTRLQYLDLTNTAVDNAGLDRLKGLAQLQVLILDNTKIGDAGLEQLKPLIQLDALSLINTQVTDAGLKHLEAMPQLENLFVGKTKVTSAGVKKLRRALPKCKIER